MASLAEDREGGLLPFGRFGTLCYCAVLTLVFLILGFPFDQVGERLVGSLSSASRSEIVFVELSPFLSLYGPGFEATGVLIVGSDGSQLALDHLKLRPAWSLAWLRLAPALHVDADGPLGRVVGTAVVDASTPAFHGELESLKLAELPVAALWPDLVLTGTLDADIDLALTEGAAGPNGTVVFEARDGGISAAGQPLGLPYETLTGELELGGDALVRIVSLEAKSPLLTAVATGEIGMNEYFSAAPIDIDIEIQAQPLSISTLRGMGIRIDKKGAGRVHIGGTPSDPVIR